MNFSNKPRTLAVQSERQTRKRATKKKAREKFNEKNQNESPAAHLSIAMVKFGSDDARSQNFTLPSADRICMYIVNTSTNI